MSRVVVVGAGPAGIRAAEVLAAGGITPTVIDEGARAGGQIYRRPPEGFTRPPEKLYGTEAAKAVALHRTFDTLAAAGRIDHRSRTSAYGLSGGKLHVAGPQGVDAIAYDRLILATGATDRVLPLPGWERAGVYTLGAAQIALKAQGMALGRRIVLAGSGPLLTLVATQLVAAGAGVAAVLDTSGMGDQVRGAAGMLARPWLVARGVAMRRDLGKLYRAGVRLDGIEGDDDSVTALRWTDRHGRAQRTECDAVALGWHLRAETQLADLAGCRFDYDQGWSQWLPAADPMGRAGKGVYLAGDGARLRGADAAELAGRLAAIACLADLGLPAPDPARDLRALSRMDRFARGLARAFPWPERQLALDPQTVICRCEGITLAALQDSTCLGGAEANRVKSLGRIGMGRCQGRFCHPAAANLIAADAGCTVAAVGRLRGQAPVRPLPAAALTGGQQNLPDTS